MNTDGTAYCPNENQGGIGRYGVGNAGDSIRAGNGGYGRNFLGNNTAGVGGSAYVNSVMALAPMQFSGGGNGGGGGYDNAAGENGVGYGGGGGGGSFTSDPGTSATWNGRAGAAGIVVIREAGYTTACTPTIQRHATATYIFTNTTTCTWTVPSNVNKIDVLMTGGGGGGGYNGGGGGSGGQIFYSQNITVAGGSTIDITIGAGGAGGTTKEFPAGNGARTITTIGSAWGGMGGYPCYYEIPPVGTAYCPSFNHGGEALFGGGNGGAPSSGSGGYGDRKSVV
jgi:hypothetical protein